MAKEQKKDTGKGRARLVAWDVALVGVMAAILLVAQVALSFLPNIEVVSLFVLVFSLHFRRHAPYAIYVFVVVEGLLYGFHIWWITYLYVWIFLYFVARLFSRYQGAGSWLWAVINGLFGLAFGALTSIPYFITGGLGGGAAYFVAGIPFDLLHCGGNFVTALLLYKPISKAMAYLAARRK